MALLPASEGFILWDDLVGRVCMNEVTAFSAAAALYSGLLVLFEGAVGTAVCLACMNILKA